MSKYNLTNILNEYIGGSRHGTINISYRDLQDAMDQVEANGDFIVREKHGQSGDGKVNREFEVVFVGDVKGDNKQEELGFTVYDYKFGFDPGSEDNFDEVLPFSVGGSNKEAALKIAKFLLGNRIQGYMASDKEILKDFDPKDLNDVLFKGEVVNEENVIKDLAQADEVIKMIKMMNPDVRADLLMRIARMGQKMDENRREKNPEGMGQLYVQPAVQKEVKFHLDAYDKGDIDVDDMIQAIEDIIFGYVKAPGMRESVGPSDKAETEDDVVNVDKVAGPSAKGRGYGAETSANTAEDDQEDKEIQNPPPMYEDMKLAKLAKKLGIDLDDLEDKIKSMRSAEKDKIEATAKSAMAENGDAEDFTKELKEAVAEEESVADYLMDYYRNPNKPEETMVDEKIVGEYFNTHKDWDLIWGKSYEDGLDDFNEFFDANYGYMFPSVGDIDEDLKKHFKRFM
tara:strand:- start:220 stop:1584 length:1365 start_codon:yes stop_codon:yes gene_type:complete